MYIRRNGETNSVHNKQYYCSRKCIQ